MSSDVQKIGPKFQVTIPKSVRTELGLKVGDLVQARVGKNHSIILERKRLVDFHKSLEEDLRASKADYAAGRSIGPFDNADDLILALNSPAKPGTFSIPKRKPRTSRSSAKYARRRVSKISKTV